VVTDGPVDRARNLAAEKGENHEKPDPLRHRTGGLPLRLGAGSGRRPPQDGLQLGAVRRRLQPHPPLRHPAAAVANGAEGAFFQTDVDINNSSSGGEATFELWWLPRGQANPSPRRSQLYTLGAGQSLRIENVLTEAFGLQPDRVGAVVLASDDERVIAMSRTYNVPGAEVAAPLARPCRLSRQTS